MMTGDEYRVSLRDGREISFLKILALQFANMDEFIGRN